VRAIILARRRWAVALAPMVSERSSVLQRAVPARLGPPLWILAPLVALVVLFVYWPSIRGGLLWDDAAHITRADLRPLSGLVKIWTNLRETQQYYPVLHSAFWLEHRIWGDATIGYHLVNMALHGFNACLFSALLSRLLRMGSIQAAPWGAAALAGLLFAAHPVCVESVAWMSEQKNTLSLALCLLAAWVYLGFCETRHLKPYLGASLLFLAALGTKTVTATLPGALLVVLWWRHGRIQARRDVLPLVPWFAVAAVSGLLTAWVERHVVGAEGAGFELAPFERLLLSGRIIWFYLGKLAWPADLAFIYPRWRLDADPWSAVPLLGALAITALLWAIRARWRGPLAAWLFFVGSLFPVLGFFNIFPFLYSFVADHFQYMASIGILATAGCSLAALVERRSSGITAAGRLLCLVLVAGLAGLARARSSAFLNSEILYRDTLSTNPSCWMAENNLAAELEGQGRAGEALDHYRSALRIRPDYPEAHNNLGNLLLKTRGSKAEARHHYEEALRIRPAFAEAHADLANLLSGTPGEEQEAVGHYEAALALKPGDSQVHFDFAVLLARLPGREAEAELHYRASISLSPDSAEAHSNLGVLFARTPGREGEALAEFAEAVRVDPRYVAAHLNAAILEIHMGRLGDARKSCERALAIDPGNMLALQILDGLDQKPSSISGR